MTRGFAIPCGQERCDGLATHRFTWPGRDEAMICNECAPKLRAVANAIGLTLQLMPLTAEDRESLEQP